MKVCKPINDPDFWKERLDDVYKIFGGKIHNSVFVTLPDLWENICIRHKKIFQEICSGKILDAACGYGRLSEWIKEGDEYTGVDFAPAFIDKARELYPDKRFILCDVKHLPFKDGEFDWAVCVSLKAMIQKEDFEGSWEEMEKELKRVAKKVLILEYSFQNYEIL